MVRRPTYARARRSRMAGSSAAPLDLASSASLESSRA
ncbi:Uncharacterised protein [Mycobacteroides abscessus subsp. abscessus]|nr:Uncharacterised protein [Mycobacteroides abscessus subsp. abscessus]